MHFSPLALRSPDVKTTFVNQGPRDASRLEQPRKQTPADLAGVLRIAFEVSREKALLIDKAPYERGNNDKDSEEPVPRVKREWHAGEQQQRSRIHGMPDQRIGASRYDL